MLNELPDCASEARRGRRPVEPRPGALAALCRRPIVLYSSTKFELIDLHKRVTVNFNLYEIFTSIEC